MAGIKFFEPYPVFMRRAYGSRIWDVDDNQYIDYLMSYGALILGHGDAAVTKSISSTLDSVGTTVLGTPSDLEAEYGETLRDLYHRDGFIRFTNSGLEATYLAVRLARAFSGKKVVAKFEGHYHGAVDRLLFSYSPDLARAGSAESPVPIGDSADVNDEFFSSSLALPFNDWDSTESLLMKHSDELSCVILEPFEEGVIPGERNFMHGLRRLTEDLKIPLIYDEVKTGFRVRIGGASEFYGITPDLTCLGKIIGGGLPIGAVVGDAKIMSALDPRGERTRRVFHSGTFNGNPLSISAGRATVEQLQQPGKFAGLVSKTDHLKRLISSALRGHQVPHVMAGEGAMFSPFISENPISNYRGARRSDLRFRRLLDLELITRGVYLKPESRYCLSTAHTDDDIRQTGERFTESLDSILTLSPS